jgi:outer membrane protein W
MIAVLAVSICARPAMAGKTSIGVKGGLNITNASGGPEEWNDTIEAIAGFTGGVFVNHMLNDKLSIQAELLYSQKGFNFALLDETDIFELDLTLNLDYFELPVLLKYAFSPEKKFRPVLFAGPSFAYCSASELTVTALGFSAGIDFSSLTHTTDFGMVLGGGFDYALSGGTLVFDTRFHYGFTHVILSGDFEINGDPQTIEEDDFTNYGLSFMLGYTF